MSMTLSLRVVILSLFRSRWPNFMAFLLSRSWVIFLVLKCDTCLMVLFISHSQNTFVISCFELACLRPNLFLLLCDAPQYLTIMRSKLTFYVNHVCQFMSKPIDPYWTAVMRILRYLKSSISVCLFFQPFPPQVPFTLHSYCDADWGPLWFRSTSGTCVYFSCNHILCWSCKQPVVFRSRNIALVTTELLWIQSLFTELHLKSLFRTNYCDDQSAGSTSCSHHASLVGSVLCSWKGSW